MQIFDDIKVEFDFEKLAASFCLSPDMPEYAEFADLLNAVKPHAAPAALLTEAEICDKTPERLISSKGEFNSSLLADLTAETEKLFPFIVTCGRTMEDFSADIEDPLQFYWLDSLKEYALEQAFGQVKTGLGEQFPDKKIISMIPTDNSVWKIEELKEIFDVFPPESREKIGVELTEYFYMKPGKTRAGVFFPAASELDICSLCTLKKCNTCPLSVNNKS
jgi:hypothetical protein